METSTILKHLQKALNLSENSQLTRHPAGEVNHVYRLKDDNTGIDYAVKWLGDDNFSGVIRPQQFALQQQLCQLNIAPKPIWLSDDESIWVELWQPNTGVAQRTPGTLANVLARIHQLSVVTRLLNLSSRWQHYLHIAALSEGDELFDRAEQLRSAVLHSEQVDGDVVLCHNDLLSDHVLCREGNTPVVIDWEYSAMGNRYFDLASCCLTNKLDETECKQLVLCYANILSIPHHEAWDKFIVQKDIVDVTNALWFEAFSGASS